VTDTNSGFSGDRVCTVFHNRNEASKDWGGKNSNEILGVGIFVILVI
jgi:hypothetical protein